MEQVYDLVKDEKAWEVNVEEHIFYHREHAFCETCGSKMRFKIEPKTKPYSGWTRNFVYEVLEHCPNGCEDFIVMEVYRNKDGRLYTSNFTDLDEKIEYILNGGKTWKQSNSK